MPAVLSEHSYGKSRIRLTKVTRLADRHEVCELTIEIQLEGDFAASYLSGDNSQLIATDTMKNVAYALAREHPFESIEDFGKTLAGHFLDAHSQVTRATVRIVEQLLERVSVAGRPHPHAFAGKSRETRTSTIRLTRGGLEVESGLDDLFLLKSTDSAFAGFVRDRYTTLRDASDRILATMLRATWVYVPDAAHWNEAHAQVRQALIVTFAGHHSLSVQHTLHAMGTAALGACAAIERITLVMPNQHRILVDLEPYGLDNVNQIFLATDEPHGTISGTLHRA